MGSLRPIFDSKSYRIAQPNRKAVRRYTAIDSQGQLRTFRVHMTVPWKKTRLNMRPYTQFEDASF